MPDSEASYCASSLPCAAAGAAPHASARGRITPQSAVSLPAERGRTERKLCARGGVMSTKQSNRGRDAQLLKPKIAANNVSGYVEARNSTGLFGGEYALYVMVRRDKHCRFGDREGAADPDTSPPPSAVMPPAKPGLPVRRGPSGQPRRRGVLDRPPQCASAHKAGDDTCCGARIPAQNLDWPPLPPYTSARSLQGQRIRPRGAQNGGRKSLGVLG
jgi:hypothetical protein